jgi:hypothetical protein
MNEFTAGELEVVTTVFRQYETGLREACIDAKVREGKVREFMNVSSEGS